jgi:hypothetical protein
MVCAINLFNSPESSINEDFVNCAYDKGFVCEQQIWLVKKIITCHETISSLLLGGKVMGVDAYFHFKV